MFDLNSVLPLILQVVEVFVSLVGVAMLIAALVNLLKLVGIVTDGNATNWTAALNLVAFIGIVAWRLLNPTVEIEQIDAIFKSIAVVIGFVITYLVQIKASAFDNDTLKMVPALRKNVGFSFKKWEGGQGMVEYALILVLVAVVVIAAVTIMGPLVGNVFSTVNASL